LAIDAFVLAGDRTSARLLYGTNKALLRLRGKPLLSYVVSALDRSEQVRSIHIVGAVERLKEGLAPYKFEKPVSFIEQGANVAKNIWYGGLYTFPEYVRDMDYKKLAGVADADKVTLGVTCDTPLLEPKEIDHFILNAPMDQFDFVFGITRKEMLVPFAPKGDDPGITFAYFVLKEIIFRQANFFLLRPLKLGYVMDEFIPLIYDIRYQKQWGNIFKGFSAIIKNGAGLDAVYYYAVLQTCRSLDMKGWNRLRDFLRQGASMPTILKRAVPVLQTRFGAFETLGPGPCIDTDNEVDLSVADRMFERWQEIQAQMLVGKYPLPQDV
jgi:GTP:adenosylcobinamide-phosphate guanylyltransferase